MKKITMNLFAVMALLSVIACPASIASEAMKQLEDMKNTGVTFDGSDGQRSGMDFDFVNSVDIQIPEPTAEPVEEDTNQE